MTPFTSAQQFSFVSTRLALTRCPGARAVIGHGPHGVWKTADGRKHAGRSGEVPSISSRSWSLCPIVTHAESGWMNVRMYIWPVSSSVQFQKPAPSGMGWAYVSNPRSADCGSTDAVSAVPSGRVSVLLPIGGNRSLADSCALGTGGPSHGIPSVPGWVHNSPEGSITHSHPSAAWDGKMAFGLAGRQLST